jgi:hypothetical protein
MVRGEEYAAQDPTRSKRVLAEEFWKVISHFPHDCPDHLICQLKASFDDDP